MAIPGRTTVSPEYFKLKQMTIGLLEANKAHFPAASELASLARMAKELGRPDSEIRDLHRRSSKEYEMAAIPEGNRDAHMLIELAEAQKKLATTGSTPS